MHGRSILSFHSRLFRQWVIHNEHLIWVFRTCNSPHRALKYIKKHQVPFSQMKFIAWHMNVGSFTTYWESLGSSECSSQTNTQLAYGNFQWIEVCFIFSLPMGLTTKLTATVEHTECHTLPQTLLRCSSFSPQNQRRSNISLRTGQAARRCPQWIPFSR